MGKSGEMLTGTYNNQLDDKGRLNFPAKMRVEMGGSFVITRWFDGCIVAFPQERWEEMSEKLNNLPPMTKIRKTNRFFFSNLEDVTPDKQGRILIPATLREHAGIDKEVVIIGAGAYAEIWSKTSYEKVCEDFDEEILEEAMGSLGL